MKNIGWLNKVQLLNHMLEAFAILGDVDGFGRGAEDGDAVCNERARELNCRLPAKRDNHPAGPLGCESSCSEHRKEHTQ